MATLLEKTDVWSDILIFVEKRLNKHIFESWFRPIRFDGRDDENKVIFLRTGHVTKDWVTLYYTDMLEQALSSVKLADYCVEWQIDETETAESKFSEISP